MQIPAFLDRDNYLQNPIMRRFLKEHKINFVDNRADYIKAIEEYASQSESAKQETESWLLKIAKEGSKEFCYRKIKGICAWHRNPALVKAKINELYPNCPQQSILTFRNTDQETLIEYNITTNDSNEVVKIDFTFSQLFLYGESGKPGNATVLPLYIEVYLDSGFIVSRAKAKSTLFKYNATDSLLLAEDKIDTMDYAIKTIDSIIALFDFAVTTNQKIVKNEVSQALYRIYEKYSFTPEDVVEQVNSQKNIINGFVDQFFSNLNLNAKNMEKATLDAQILVEKFISINGHNENTFKEDRSAYLIKVSTDDELELTKVDTTSAKTVPLQCTEAFFDSKKAVLKSKQCKRLDLIFKRTNEEYFPRSNSLVVQLGTHKDHGYAKTMQYAEEADIQNVLQAIFESY